ncbi:ATP-binding protein [Anaerolineales bacterium HSG6]|nr:ATP-binding protein [Anaerolineales bacterium HSG6]MDM8531618.1 ATP-binding protein [Anaerolineales bacterium HSG25]
MRKFHSYEEVDKDVHYYVSRHELIDRAYNSLIGDTPEKGGHYITVWGPRQSGKTWVMREVVRQLQAQQPEFEVAILSLQSARSGSTDEKILKLLVTQLKIGFKRDFPIINDWEQLPTLFTSDYFDKPVILILDEFDSMGTEHINQFATEFRHIYISRQNEVNQPTGQKTYLLHSLALIGVRSVLGIENKSGSPFNIQRSLPIPHLTFAEVDSMFHWYERESGQTVHQEVIDRVFHETQGQPGLVGWLGEQLTEDQFNKDTSKPIDMALFNQVYGAALYVLPNNNILNLISKARQEPYKQVVLELFNTKKIPFSYDNPISNYLYLNGVISWEQEDTESYYTRFPCPFVQRRLFNAFTDDMFSNIGQLYPPFTDLSQVITADTLNVKNLMRVYEQYLQKNRHWLLTDAPVRKDLRIYEAVYHFNLYSYLQAFFRQWKGRVYPEFPTGNGQIDLLITYQGQQYGLEVKSFSDDSSYREGLTQSIRYGKRLGLKEVVMVTFIEQVSDEIRQKYEAPHLDNATGITVLPVFVESMSK